MANHNLYLELSHQEKFVKIGKLIHLYQNSTVAFEAMEHILAAAESVDYFKEVKINPTTDEKQNY
jgi:hypothetical protein